MQCFPKDGAQPLCRSFDNIGPAIGAAEGILKARLGQKRHAMQEGAGRDDEFKGHEEL
jgi:hypothetical protein